ncbi:MAG: IclR family transcriptional regulator [Rhizobiaceae bacterium]|nr:IclR family transcriptional regulator [Rhizobiaceae bacterium]
MAKQPPPHEKELTGAQSVDRALGLLSLVARQAARGMSLKEIVEESGFNKPTTRRLLLALMRAGFIEQGEGDRQYYIGQEAYVIGTLASPRFDLLRLSMESLIRIARKTEDASFVSIRRDTHAICLHREEGTYPIRTHALQTGYEHPLGVGAGSLAMLASLDDAEIEVLLARNAETLVNDYPRMTPAQIWRDVAATRTRGYAFNPGLIYANSWGLGMAVRHPDGRLAGALSIAAIDSRMQEPRLTDLVATLREETRRVEARLAELVSPAEPAAAKQKTRTVAHGRTQSPRRLAL